MSPPLMHFGPWPLQVPCVRQSLQARAGGEEQMSKASPGGDRGPSLASRDNTQNQSGTSPAAIENAPGNQVRKHALFYGYIVGKRAACFSKSRNR